MKKIIVLGVLMITMLFSSCNLDTAPSNKVSDAQAVSSLNSIQMSVLGLYNRMNLYRQGESGYEGLHGLQNGQGWNNNYNVYDDIIGGTVVLSQYDWWTAEYDFRAHIEASRDRAPQGELWYLPYKVLRPLNTLLAPSLALKAGLTDEGEIKEINQVLGQLHGLRALMYHTLNMRFAIRYNELTAATTLSVPIRETVGDEPMARNTQKEVIDFVFSEIQKSQDYFAAGTQVVSTKAMNGLAVKVLKARVQMYTMDYTSALATAKDIIANPEGRAIMGVAAYQEGFNSVANKEWIFGAVTSSSDNMWYASFLQWFGRTSAPRGNPIVLDLSYIFGFTGDPAKDLMEDEVPYEGGIPKTDDLVMRLSDTRSAIFITDTSAEIEANLAANKSYYTEKGFGEGQVIWPGVSRKFAASEGGSISDMVGMRLAEVYYIAAESAAYLNQDAEARGYLLKTIEPYDSAAGLVTYLNKSGARLKTMIGNYKAVDMWIEGRRFEDVKRRGDWVYRTQRYNTRASFTPTRQYRSISPYTTRPMGFDNILLEPITRTVLDRNTLLERNF